MKAKKIIAAALAGVMTLSQLLAGVPAAAAAQTDALSDSVFNNEGVWLTEIYSNDVNRSKQTSGYEEIKTFSSSEDLMEFVEIFSTHKEAISLNDTYDFYYGETPITVTTVDGSSDITIEPEQTMVLWNCRSDLGTKGMPTAQDFISEMRVDEDAVVLVAKTNGTGGGWAANNYAFSIKDKEGNTVSAFTCPSGDNVYTLDGYSVALKVADLGSEMLVYREDTIPSAGKVYSPQLNGLVQAKMPEGTIARGLFITEVRPNDTDRTAAYSSTGEKTKDDLMECFELVNTTDHDIDLNAEYNFKYVVKESQRKPFDLQQYDENAAKFIGSTEGCVIPAGGVAVVWNYRINHLKNLASFPTMADFRAAYNIPGNVPVYLWTNQNGVGNDNRSIELYKVNGDGSEELACYYDWVGDTDAKDNKSAILAVNPEGPQMLLSSAHATSTLGTVTASQYTYLQDDGSALTLRLAKATDTFAQVDEVVPTSVVQGEEIRVDFYYAVTGALPRTGLTTYYRFDGEGEWKQSVESSARIPNLYECIISADELFDHDYVEFYASASNRYRSTLSDLYRVEILKLNEVDGVRTNISDGENVSGTVSFTANNGGDNAGSEIYIDGVKQTTVPMLEDGAYLSFYADGRDSYFKNAITTTDNKWVTAIGKWQTAISNGQTHHIDNSYFTYNAAKDTYDVTLRFWAGTYGTTVDEYLYPEANREDFKVSQLELKLINGNSYLPDAIGPAQYNGVSTSAKTNLSTDYDAVHSIGDSANMCPYMDATFSIPASEVNAVGVAINTTTLTEGAHTLKVVNGKSSSEVTFIVDNIAPVVTLGVTDGTAVPRNTVLNPTVTDEALDFVTYALDGEEIQVPYVPAEGEHILSVLAEDKAGNQTTATATFTVSSAAITLAEADTTNITDSSAKAYLKLQSQSATDVTFYAAEKIETANIETANVTGILPHIQYTIQVGDVADDTQILAAWDGTASGSDDTHATTMFVLNTATAKWDKIGSVDAEGSIDASFTAKDHVKDGKATVIIQCTADSALPDLDTATDGVKDANAGWDGTTVPADYDFSFAWITDTQYYAEQWQHHFLNMNNYIVDNAEALKTKYVIHTGDIVDDWDMVYEWENADEAMKIFDDAGMPYGVLGGNHDVAAGLEDNEYYFDYFGEDRFTSQPTYGGSYVNNLGHYDLISENGQDFIIVYMSWNVYQEEIDWMNDVLAQYADRKAILCFHPYTNVKASNDGILDYFGVLIQKEVVAKNPNVFAVLNGHYHGSSYQTVTFDDDNDGIKERTVYQICTDYQSAFEGGTEYIKYLYFDLDSDKVFINSYSPYLNDYNYYDGTGVDNVADLAAASETGVVNKVAIDTIVLDVDFDSDVKSIEENSFSAYLSTGEKLGAVTMDENGTAAVEMTGLDAETEYAWYAVAQNEQSGSLKTGVYEFATENAGTGIAEPFDIVSVNNVMGNELALYFYVNQSDLDGTDYYAEIVMQNADGSTTEATVPFAKWEVSGSYYRFRFDGIAAKQMSDEITVIVYNGDGSVASNARVTSMRDYTMRALETYADDADIVTMLVDMLNYGAAAQSYFGYNIEDPANNQLTEAQQAMATQSVELANNRVVGANYGGVSLTYGNQILLTMYFKEVTEDMYAVVEFTDHYGNPQTDTVYYNEFETRSNLKGVIADELAVADFRSVVKCTVYNADGTVHGYCEDSAESYAATMGANDPLFQAAAKFSQSAYNYFH